MPRVSDFVDGDTDVKLPVFVALADFSAASERFGPVNVDLPDVDGLVLFW